MLEYINVKYAASRLTNIVFCIYVCPPIQEEAEGGIMTIASSQIKGGLSILHRQIDENKEHR